MRIYFHTFGCKVNQYDTEALRGRLLSGGAQSVSEPSSADLFLINSCSVTQEAERECRQFIRRFLKVNPRARVVVTGCYATRAPDEISSLSSRVEVYTNLEKDNLPSCLGFEIQQEPMGLTRFGERVRAFVKIQDGCRASCSYCIIPTTRPRWLMKPLEHVIEEVQNLVHQGFAEVVLTGIRLGLYSYRGKRLPDLLESLAQIPGNFRIRLSSLEVTEVTEHLLATIEKYSKICHHLHVPLQSGDDGVLLAMKRWYGAQDYASRIESVLKRFPDCGITADVMVGFPTETPKAFENTISLVRQIQLTGLHVFRFSPRPGTPAAQKKSLHPHTIRERAKALLDLDKILRRSFFGRFFGTTRFVIPEPSGFGWTDNYIRVRTPQGAPVGQLIPLPVV